MKLIDIKKIADKLEFNNYVDRETFPKSNLRCPNCKSNVSIHYKNLSKHAFNQFTNLSDTNNLKIESFIETEGIKKENSFLDYNCPDCKNPIRIYYEAWGGGRHGEAGFELKFGIVEKDELAHWRIEFEEQSNNVWVYKMIHETGSTIEKIGTNLSELLQESRKDAIEMNKQLKDK